MCVSVCVFCSEIFYICTKNISYATQHTDSKKDVVASFVVVSPDGDY